ncbi:hypothetical protein SDC9_207238 [bioreactor metagenome]|uniref:Uncharacterized protein n=1 Tax=bioreactor metagenome TaxID=1076179 RepID=A0A645J7Z3_9ZZZZ
MRRTAGHVGSQRDGDSRWTLLGDSETQTSLETGGLVKHDRQQQAVIEMLLEGQVFTDGDVFLQHRAVLPKAGQHQTGFSRH